MVWQRPYYIIQTTRIAVSSIVRQILLQSGKDVWDIAFIGDAQKALWPAFWGCTWQRVSDVSNRPFHGFLKFFLINASKRISIDTTGKKALKLVTLPSLNARSKRNFTDIYIVGHEFVPHHTNVGQIYRLFWAISSLVFNKWLSNLATLLILRRSFQSC